VLVFTNRTISHVTVSRLSDDKTCYTIRSYVVARDESDSDSTHSGEAFDLSASERLPREECGIVEAFRKPLNRLALHSPLIDWVG
jgi:hypothetical protein